MARWALPPASQKPTAEGWGDRNQLGEVLRAPGVLDASVTNAVLTVIQTGVLVFLFPLYLVNRGGFAPAAVGVLTSVGILGRLVALWVGGSVSDRWGRMRVLVAGLLAYAALLGSVPFLTHPVALSLWSLALGAAAGFVAPLPTAVVADRVLPPLHGLAIGWLRTMTDSGQILGPLVMGACADALDLSAPFHLGAALLLAAAWRCGRQGRRTPASGHDKGKRMTRASDRVMVVTAHPDDPEFGAGGTIAKLVKEGREVTYVIVTNGNKGSSDRAIAPERLALIREAEQRNAARALGVEHVEFLGYEDGEVEDTRQLRLDVTRQIRRWQPDLIITQHPIARTATSTGGTATTGSRPASCSIASTRLPATISRFPSCSRTTSPTRCARST